MVPDHERQSYVSAHNPQCPLNGCGAPERMIRPLRAIAAAALAKPNHCTPITFVLHDSGEIARSLVRSYAATLRLPYVGCTALRIRTANDLLVRIASVCEATTFPTANGTGTLELVPVVKPAQPERFGGKSFLVVPPCVVLVRNVERLDADVLHRLRLAVDASDPVLYAADWPAVTEHVSWFIHCERPTDLPDELEGLPVLGVRP
jgi:hypothetical protein